MKIKVGQKVKWVGNFGTHPVGANGGDKPNPISTFDETSGEVTFTAAGTFGFQCQVHASMKGAIQVVQ